MTAFLALARLVKPGQAVLLRILIGEEGPMERAGVLVELLPQGLVLETDGEIEYISSSEVAAWRFQKTPGNNIRSSSPGSHQQEPAELDHKTQTASPEQTVQTPANALPSQSTEELEVLFAGEPALVHSAPSFDIPELVSGMRKEVDRWHNRYDYAQKVREPARMAQDVPHVAELAESLDSPELFALAGSFAYISGLGVNRARTYYEIALAGGSRRATVALASLALEESDWLKAAEFLLSALLISGEFEDKASLMRTLGQCVLRLQKKQLPGLGNLVANGLTGPAQRLLVSLTALVVADDAEAYRAALGGDAEGLRRTEVGKGLFIDEQSLQSRHTPRRTLPSGNRDSRRGRVSAFYSERNFGFIVEDTTGQIWFFHSTSVADSLLLGGLRKSEVRQYVRFTGNPEGVSGKYPLAVDVRIISTDGSIPVKSQDRAPLRVRLAGVPKDGSHYARAKRAEQLDELDEADDLYLEEILRNGSHLKSAVKDLAALRNRKGNPESAIAVLQQHRSNYVGPELISLDQMRVQFLVKARRFIDASRLVAQLANQESRPHKRLELLRQEAYCHFAAGAFDTAIGKLNKLLKSNPHDNATILLIERVQQTKDSGSSTDETARMAEDIAEGDESLASLALGLSVIARKHLDQCDLRGVDARARETNQYSTKDFQQVERLLADLKGRRPRERSDYLLTLAALCDRAPEISGQRSVHEYMRRHFLAVSEAAMSEQAPMDVIRCYALESLLLCPESPERGREAATTIEAALVMLLGTYCSESMQPSVLLRPDPGDRVPQVFRLLNNPGSSWKSFLADAQYYRLRAPASFRFLEALLGKDLPTSPQDLAVEKVRLREEDADFHLLFVGPISADRLRKARELLAQRVQHVHFELDRQRLLEAVRVFSDSADYALERHFRERETRYLRLEGELNRYIDDISRLPTHMSAERLYPLVSSLLTALREDFARSDTALPTLDIRNVLKDDFYAANEGLVALRLLLTSRDESSPPIEAIDLLVDGGTGDPCHSPEPLHGGQSRELELLVHPLAEQIADGAFTVNIVVQYRNRSGAMERLEPHPLAVRLGRDRFEEIPNPYSRYSGGSPVDEESMFFGRRSLVDKVVRHLSTGDLGQCFVLFGQKRSGKSSVLKQVEKQLAEKCLFASISAGAFDPARLWGSFARLFVQELEFRLEDAGGVLPEGLPSLIDVEKQPVEAIRTVSRTMSKLGHRVIVAIDEFTYIFENSGSGIEEFMRGWKALLEAKAFNALLVGQDTMPRFKQTYPNEFGVTHDERISYLAVDEAELLATKPILLNGDTRYRGQALQRLFDLTAGSPFFLQIVCDRLVRHLNDRHAPFVTEADIEQVRQRLTVGTEALPPERFDPLVTAAGERVATIPREDLWRFLTRVARESLHSGWCYRNAIADLPRAQETTKDLVDREVLASEGDRVSIRVGLFASWLRSNQ